MNCPLDQEESSPEHWVNTADLSSLPLEPVELIQVGNAYFVSDGHHRISVARALGQVATNAEVIIWKAQPPFPWEADGMKMGTGEVSIAPAEAGQNPSGACCV